MNIYQWLCVPGIPSAIKKTGSGLKCCFRYGFLHRLTTCYVVLSLCPSFSVDNIFQSQTHPGSASHAD